MRILEKISKEDRKLAKLSYVTGTWQMERWKISGLFKLKSNVTSDEFSRKLLNSKGSTVLSSRLTTTNFKLNLSNSPRDVRGRPCPHPPCQCPLPLDSDSKPLERPQFLCNLLSFPSFRLPTVEVSAHHFPLTPLLSPILIFLSEPLLSLSLFPTVSRLLWVCYCLGV